MVLGPIRSNDKKPNQRNHTQGRSADPEYEAIIWRGWGRRRGLEGFGADQLGEREPPIHSVLPIVIVRQELAVAGHLLEFFAPVFPDRLPVARDENVHA